MAGKDLFGVDVDNDANSIASYLTENSNIRRERLDPFSTPPYTIEYLKENGKLHKIKLNKINYRLNKRFKCIGYSKLFSYRYISRQPKTSSFYRDFVSDNDNRIENLNLPFIEFQSPSIDDFVLHLNEFGTNDVKLTRTTRQYIDEAVAQLKSLENIKLIEDWLDQDHIHLIKVPSQTSPGLRFKAMGYKTKKAALPAACIIARSAIKAMIEKGEMPEEVPCQLAGRAKQVDTLSNTKQKEGRMIMVPCIVRHLIGSLAMQPFAHMVKDSPKYYGGVMLGLSPYGTRWQRFCRILLGYSEGEYIPATPGLRSRRFKKFVMLDFSGFDSSLPEWLIKISLDDVASTFSTVPGSKTYWKHEYQRLARTCFAMPEGHVFKKPNGLTSGDPWTATVNSRMNYYILHSVCSALGYNVCIWTYGDDAIIGFKYPEPGKPSPDPDLNRMSNLAKSMFGVKLHPDKSYISDFVLSKDDPSGKGVSFLSTYFTDYGLPTIESDRMVKKLWSPEKLVESIIWEKARALAYYFLSFNNLKVRFHIADYFHYLCRFDDYHDFMHGKDIMPIFMSVGLNKYDLEHFQLVKLPDTFEMTCFMMTGRWNIDDTSRRLHKFPRFFEPVDQSIVRDSNPIFEPGIRIGDYKVIDDRLNDIKLVNGHSPSCPLVDFPVFAGECHCCCFSDPE